jgi:hypothetical protein
MFVDVGQNADPHEPTPIDIPLRSGHGLRRCVPRHSTQPPGDWLRSAPAPLSATAIASPDYLAKPTALAMPVLKAAL